MAGLLRKKSQPPGLVGVSQAQQGLALAHIVSAGGSLRLPACEFLDLSAGKPANVLADKVEALELQNARCNFVLSSNDYKLLLVEAPKVQTNEMTSALRWRVKDLIDHPVEEVALDHFPVPEEAYRSQGEMLYVVVVSRQRIIAARDLVEDAGLRLDCIDIPELAMRNLTSICADDSNGLAFIDLRDADSTLNLCKNGDIYLTRHLSTHIGQAMINSQDWEQVKERLVLELQRSLDYYESQMGQGHIGRLMIAPHGPNSPALARELDEAMGAQVEVMDLSATFESELELDSQRQQDCLLAIGGALKGQEPSSVEAAA